MANQFLQSIRMQTPGERDNNLIRYLEARDRAKRKERKKKRKEKKKRKKRRRRTAQFEQLQHAILGHATDREYSASVSTDKDMVEQVKTANAMQKNTYAMGADDFDCFSVHIRLRAIKIAGSVLFDALLMPKIVPTEWHDMFKEESKNSSDGWSAYKTLRDQANPGFDTTRADISRQWMNNRQDQDGNFRTY